MLPTLALALTLAAPVPKATPFPLRTDPLPKVFKFADLEDAAVPRGEKGAVGLLAWETIEDDRPHIVTHALLVKKFDKADRRGNRYSLTLVYRKPDDTDWQHRFIAIPPALPGEKVVYAGDAFHFGCQHFAKPPTDKELTKFLDDVSWTPRLGREVANFLDGKRVITTKLAGGGFDRDTWKTQFDRDPPVELFPELKAEEK